MRNVVLLAIVFGSVPLSLMNPYIGVLVWFWIAYFNPHRFAWGFAYYFPVAMTVAIPTLVGTIFARKTNRIFAVRDTFLLALLWIWYGVTYIHSTTVPLFAGHQQWASFELQRLSKILLMTFVMLLLVTSQKKLKLLLLLTVACFGLLALKGVLFGIRTAGESRVWGPPDSFIGDNNSFALALNMSLPILFFLARDEENRRLRKFLYVAFVCCTACVVLTYSRGGLLGLAVVLAAISLKSRHKFLSAVLLVLAGLTVLTFAPEPWMNRMEGFMRGSLDQSAQQRVIAWRTAWAISKDYPITGAGFHGLPDVELFQRYQPEPLPGGFLSTGPHSIYFQLLADHGFVGLALFLLLITSCFASLCTLRNQARRIPPGRWLENYSNAIEVSLLGYLVSGAFLGLAYFDLFYQVVATTILLKVLYREEALIPALAQERSRLIAVPEQAPS